MYAKTYRPDHPRADVTGLIAVHIVTAEHTLGRYIIKGTELVHHCDFNRLNNTPSNLLVMTRIEHQNFPKFQARFILQKGLYKEFIEWWKIERNKEESLEEQLQYKIVKAQNDRERIKAKIENEIRNH